MKHRTIFIFVLILVNVILAIGLSHWRSQKQRYAGATGPFDNQLNRWIAEMKEESLDVTLLKLTDAAEYGWYSMIFSVIELLLTFDASAPFSISSEANCPNGQVAGN